MAKHLTLCHDCDLIVNLPDVAAKQITRCPRCHANLPHNEHQGLQLPIAMSLAGLILVVPANTLPIMSLSILGKANANTMINGAFQLFEGGYWWMAFLVFACSVLAPVFILTLRFLVCLGVAFKISPAIVAPLLKSYQHITHWAMLDVYMLGILVAFVKMKDLGDLVTDLGLYSFVALLLLSSWSTAVFNAKALWCELQR